jgi:hypothetical protein
MTTMASTHTFTLFSLAAMLATGCGSKGHTGDTGARAMNGTTRQGSGSCRTEWEEYSGTVISACLTTYGEWALPEITVPACEESGGEWSDQACPDGFEGRCELEFDHGMGFEWYFYDMPESAFDSHQSDCEGIGGIWHE